MERLSGALTQLGIAHIPFVHSNVRFTTGKIVLKAKPITAQLNSKKKFGGMELSDPYLQPWCWIYVPVRCLNYQVHRHQFQPMFADKEWRREARAAKPMQTMDCKF